MKKALALVISVLLIVGMLSTSAFAAQTTFNHLDIKTAAKFAYLDAFGTQQQVSITWTNK